MDPIDAPKIRKLELGVKEPRGSDIKRPNPCEGQTTHFISCIESPNVDNSFCNHKNVRTTPNVKLIISISSTKEGKTQVGWVDAIG